MNAYRGLRASALWLSVGVLSVSTVACRRPSPTKEARQAVGPKGAPQSLFPGAVSDAYLAQMTRDIFVAPWRLGRAAAAGRPGVATGAGAQTVVGLQIEPKLLRIPKGLTVKPYVRVDYSDGKCDYRYSTSGWKVAATSGGAPVASVDDSGQVTARSAGQVELTISYLGRTVATTLTVFDEPPAELMVSADYETLDRGTHLQFSARAQFGTDLKWWDVEKLVTWGAADLAPGKSVLSLQPDGNVIAINVGQAEVSVALSGRRAVTPVMVVEPAADSPQRSEGHKFPPSALYRLCMKRLRRIWLPKLRALTNAPVELKGKPGRRTADIDVWVRGAEQRSIEIFWNPDECDAGGPTSGWRPAGFDWQAPQTPIEKMLALAGSDCMSYQIK